MSRKIIVSFTSYPKRINIVLEVLKSLFVQTIKPDEIILWLCLKEFPKKEQDLPNELCDLIGMNGFKVCWKKENLKSHKKYYYVLQEYSNDIVITVDDDTYYSSTMIEELLKSYYKHPNAISARNVHMILRYKEQIADYDMWDGICGEYADLERQDLCAIGCAGILYPPHIAQNRWFDKKLIQEFCPNQDDLWLKFNEILDGIPVVYIEAKSEDTIFIAAQEFALYKTNIYENQNNISIKKLFNWCKIQDNKSVDRWFHCLLECNVYYELKRKKLALNLETLLEKNKGKTIFICGAGKFAKVLVKLFIYCNKKEKISGLIVSDMTGNPYMIDEIPVLLMTNIQLNSNVLVICGVGEKNRQILKPYFDNYDCDWLDLDIYSIFNCFDKLNYKIIEKNVKLL